MKKNVGRADKSIRIILGILVAAAGIYFKSWWGLLSLIPLATAFFNFCGLYSIFGWSTCRIKPTNQASTPGPD